MSLNVLINGVGRIGKAVLKQLLKSEDFKIVGINDINPYIENIIYSINYDSTYGKYEDKFKIVEDNFIQNSNTRIKVTNFDSLCKIELSDVDIIIDASGKKEDIKLLESLPVKAIFLTHPNKDANINIVLGVNEDKLDLNSHKVISTSSCNATALLPALKIIDDKKEIICGDIVTIHPLLNHQRVLDGSFVQSATRGVDLNFEFGRSSTQNIIPSQTTTIKACSYVVEKFNPDLISSNSLRVPTDTVGVINVTLFTKESSSKDEIKNLFLEFEKNQKLPIVLNNFEALVSSDFKQEKFTTIVDHRFLEVKQNMIKLLLWYDNEWGYASKVVDILDFYRKKYSQEKS
ncbi:glyceraldehyde 3-phosphate dehydrogenase NAD-binding domain-containing protein [Aliarcobacter thereius]|uniref:Glyceraldehyde-3-phosphate dehydrogenase 2 n=2 Tax=Aliarcobacter thereius TaxID=544718 RepID=A0A1C0B9X7_9BACT|nr:glyceraldehyde 3-phosphate dehydrogenase NAD-binding domain-containing protein [Aliarcobacter thereius]OCL91977.1 Glyceraldehyde-3-phosphate dehydrogenase 2 [Aliarcobacter thereius]OCL94925.1 Glyceraldehyde-3-phosphate dehydrogenase 2 [Aliarcobacter thereius LMG 24486]OCM00373.1 Glyceraldehyde-3-phosphate dehydrogenase 2 [Aliarcobacter thereius]QBF15203.1 glyceraldehyde-3-phosphate dehydrogenase [Aliarcobacter thereius LMG 24486]TLS91942.1 aldehyde dehydrogenase [Aliarcobacter thereius]